MWNHSIGVPNAGLFHTMQIGRQVCSHVSKSKKKKKKKRKKDTPKTKRIKTTKQ